MRDNPRMLTLIFLFAALISAGAVVIAAWMITNGNKPQPTTPSTLTQPVTQASSLLLPPPQGTLVFNEDFEDASANGIALNSEADTTKSEIIDNSSDSKLLQVENMSTGNWASFGLNPPSSVNQTIAYKVMLVKYDLSLGNGSGTVACNFRSNLASRYLFAFQPDVDVISINYQAGTDGQWFLLNNAYSLYDFNKNVWYEVIINLNGNEITVYLDGKNVLTTKDDSLKTGTIFFSIAPSTIVQFDDIRVWLQP